MNKNPEKQKTSEDYEHDAVISSRIGGGLILAVGILIAAATLASDDKTGIVSALIIAPVIIAASAFIMTMPRREKKREEALKDPDSNAFRKESEKLKAEIDKLRSKAHSHKGLREHYFVRPIFISGAFLAAVLILDVILFLFVGISVFMIVIGVIALVVFLFFVSGKDFRRVVKKFTDAGIPEDDADRMFSESDVYRSFEGTIMINDRFIFCYGADRIVPREEICWAFIQKKVIYNYYNGIYTGKTEKRKLVIITDSGFTEMEASRAVCGIIIGELAAKGITAGYSAELMDFYQDSSSPQEFREKAHELAPSSPYAEMG